MGLSPSSSRPLKLTGFSSKLFWMSIRGVEPKIAVRAEEDIEADPDRWCSSTRCGQERWQIARPLGVEAAASAWAAEASGPGTRHPRGLPPKKPLLCS
jgi:hypothetical protein